MDAQAEAHKYVIPNQFTEVAERNGANGLNAETGLDNTQYFWSMPENRLELWAWLESGRLADVVPREFYKERDVVMEERRMRTDSNPFGRLFEQFVATAYVAHNYGRSGVGWPSEVSQIYGDRGDGVPQEVLCGVEHRGRRGGRCEGGAGAADAGEVFQQSARRTQAGRHDDRRAEAVCREVGSHPRADSAGSTSRAIIGRAITIPMMRFTTRFSDIMSNGRVSRLYRSLVREQQIAAEARDSARIPGDKYPSLFVVLCRSACPVIHRRRCATRFTKRLRS